jgi:hypothetical protein
MEAFENSDNWQAIKIGEKKCRRRWFISLKKKKDLSSYTCSRMRVRLLKFKFSILLILVALGLIDTIMGPSEAITQ